MISTQVNIEWYFLMKNVGSSNLKQGFGLKYQHLTFLDCLSPFSIRPSRMLFYLKKRATPWPHFKAAWFKVPSMPQHNFASCFCWHSGKWDLLPSNLRNLIDLSQSSAREPGLPSTLQMSTNTSDTPLKHIVFSQAKEPSNRASSWDDFRKISRLGINRICSTQF